MKPDSHTDPPAKTACTDISCSTGTCGGSGLCPGIALYIAMILGSAITMLTGLESLGWTVGIPLAVILITGA